MQAAFGFMCTLDPMGYMAAQYNIVPFLTLLQSYRQTLESKDTVQKEIYDMILETCQVMVENNSNLREQIINMANTFGQKPEGRTADVVPSVQVLTSQLLCLSKLTPEQ